MNMYNISLNQFNLIQLSLNQLIWLFFNELSLNQLVLLFFN